ncbi:unnamed protein product [Acanthosepion pharaonis]|uniref:Uncharacterized protein n=1 Tax=Acanthosepion pharaonis TaxID=158019 RepID=A0A812BUN1_ACAPH|nr:unnamed protein product [Sepia pharaonis]
MILPFKIPTVIKCLWAAISKSLHVYSHVKLFFLSFFLFLLDSILIVVCFLFFRKSISSFLSLPGLHKESFISLYSFFLDSMKSLVCLLLFLKAINFFLSFFLSGWTPYRHWFVFSFRKSSFSSTLLISGLHYHLHILFRVLLLLFSLPLKHHDQNTPATILLHHFLFVHNYQSITFCSFTSINQSLSIRSHLSINHFLFVHIYQSITFYLFTSINQSHSICSHLSITFCSLTPINHFLFVNTYQSITFYSFVFINQPLSIRSYLSSNHFLFVHIHQSTTFYSFTSINQPLSIRSHPSINHFLFVHIHQSLSIRSYLFLKK